MVIAHMANGAKEQALLRLGMGQFISFVTQDNESTFTDISFLSYNQKSEEIMLYVLSLENSFKKGSVLKQKDWKVKREILSAKFSKLYEIRDKMKSIKHLQFSSDKDRDEKDITGFLCQTEQDILFITEKGITEVFTSKGDLSLANVKMIYSQSGQNYFITEELSS